MKTVDALSCERRTSVSVWVKIIMSWSSRKSTVTVNHQAQGYIFLLRFKEDRAGLRGQREEKQSDWDSREKFNSTQIWVSTELPRAAELHREQELCAFLPAPRNMRFLWWSSVSPKDFLFPILNLQTVSYPRLMLRWLMKHIHHLICCVSIENQFFGFHLFFAQCTMDIFIQKSNSCANFQYFVCLFFNSGKHRPPRGGIWVVGRIWICCQKELAVLSQIRLCFRLHWPPTAC